MTLSDKQVAAIRKALGEQLLDALFCTRCWSAWGFGTMTQDDFESVDTELIIEAIIKEVALWHPQQ